MWAAPTHRKRYVRFLRERERIVANLTALRGGMASSETKGSLSNRGNGDRT